jgi:hypothetical protein
MDANEVILTGGIGVLASIVTAYVTYRLTARQERLRHEREVAKIFAQMPSTRDESTRISAIQFAQGCIVVTRKDEVERDRVFLPSGSRITLGRDPRDHIRVANPTVSSTHLAFHASDTDALVEPLGAINRVLVNGKPISEPTKLRDGDRISIEGADDFSLTYIALTR